MAEVWSGKKEEWSPRVFDPSMWIGILFEALVRYKVRDGYGSGKKALP